MGKTLNKWAPKYINESLKLSATKKWRKIKLNPISNTIELCLHATEIMHIK